MEIIRQTNGKKRTCAHIIIGDEKIRWRPEFWKWSKSDVRNDLAETSSVQQQGNKKFRNYPPDVKQLSVTGGLVKAINFVVNVAKDERD